MPAKLPAQSLSFHFPSNLINSETCMKKTILVVEDEAIVAMDLKNILTDLGYEVPDTVASGEEAIQKALELRPDLILMDIHLSREIDGIDAAKKIIQDLDIPVIYLTAYADEETLERASQTATFGYILKPFEAREIRANLEIAFYKYRIEQELKENRQWLLAILNSISDAVVASDLKGNIQFINPIAAALTGYQSDEIVNRNLSEIFNFIQESTRFPIENPILTALSEGHAIKMPDNTLLLSRTGQEIPVADSASPIVNQAGITYGAVMVFRDVTQEKREREQLEYNALHDALTDLPNRSLFLNRLQQAVDRSKRISSFRFTVMLLDLDRFKSINDTLGHLLGDQLLIAAANRFKTHLRSIDTVARFGGDEFAILLEDAQDLTFICRMAERILDELQKPIRIDEHEILVTASIGIVLSSMPYNNTEELLKDADIAMYRAKQRGRSCYEVFNTDMHSQAKALLQLEYDLRQAILHKSFQVYYQPIVDLSTCRILSLEALIRWPDPQGKLIPPTEFILVAEETGLIYAIDQLVMHESCCQLKKWHQLFGNRSLIFEHDHLALVPTSLEDFTPLSINVNLSSKQFSQKGLVESFTRILQTTGLQGNAIKLEITESAFIENADAAAVLLSQLKTLGIKICLDDFGTGYSSLSYLQKFPIDVVKIDRSFIQGIESDSEKLEIVRAIIGLCRNLGIAVTAEGIETYEQYHILLELGCEYGQGYLFSHPLNGTTITDLVNY